MDREVFVLANGESFTVWDVRISNVRVEQRTFKYMEKCCGGDQCSEIERERTYPVEAASIEFRAAPGKLERGMHGQLSVGNDSFYVATILTVERLGDTIFVTCDGYRNVKPPKAA
jgi:hypothetical protein